MRHRKVKQQIQDGLPADTYVLWLVLTTSYKFRTTASQGMMLSSWNPHRGGKHEVAELAKAYP